MKNKYKYPRTSHLPYSECITKEDKRIDEEKLKEYLQTKNVMVTEKLDGENTTLYKDYFHARSLSKPNHPSQHWLKNYHSSFAYKIPNGWRICGENMYATHTIKYNNLESYFYVFSVWDDKNNCLSWDDTCTFCTKLGLITTPLWFRGSYTDFVEKRPKFCISREGVEGFVLRNSNSFYYNKFNENVFKFVSKVFEIKTNNHWSYKKIRVNGLEL